MGYQPHKGQPMYKGKRQQRNRIKPNQGNESYKKYLASGRWEDLKRQFLKPNSACRACDSTKWLTLHHKTYENLGHETENDFIILCWKCHRKIHFDEHGWKRSQLKASDHYQKLYVRKKRREIWSANPSRKKDKPFSCAIRYSKNYY